MGAVGDELRGCLLAASLCSAGLGHHLLLSCEEPYRSDRKPARTSSEKSLGCSHAAKCPPLGELVEVNELGVRPLRPAPRSRKEIVGENAYGGRDNDALNAKERITLVFPIETGPRERRIRQPGERD